MIKRAISQNDFERINNFFAKMWKEEFNLDRSNEIEAYKKGKVFFIEENSQIISAIFLIIRENNWAINRFGTLKDFRGKGYGRKVFDEAIKFLKENKAEKLYVFASDKKLEMYEHLGFQNLGEIRKVGENTSIKMLKNL